MSVRYFVGKRGAGRDFLIGGVVVDVMSTDKVIFGGEDLELKRRVILDMCTKLFLCLEKTCT